jgi:hypothetical protein
MIRVAKPLATQRLAAAGGIHRANACGGTTALTPPRVSSQQKTRRPRSLATNGRY